MVLDDRPDGIGSLQVAHAPPDLVAMVEQMDGGMRTDETSDAGQQDFGFFHSMRVWLFSDVLGELKGMFDLLFLFHAEKRDLLQLYLSG
jgi:hypothetical protein